MKTPEGKTLDAIVRLLKRTPNLWYVKLHGANFQRAGLPDLIVCYRGRLFGFEVKAPDGEATPKQEHELAKMAAAGAATDVVRSADEVDAILFSTPGA